MANETQTSSPPDPTAPTGGLGRLLKHNDIVFSVGIAMVLDSIPKIF